MADLKEKVEVEMEKHIRSPYRVGKNKG